MRTIIPDITIIDYGKHDDTFKVRWHVRNKVEAEVNVNSKKNPSLVTIKGSGRVEWVVIPYATAPSVGNDSEEYLRQMEDLIKATCIN